MQLKFIFQAALPSIATNLVDKLLVDVGSRLGAVLYGVSVLFYYKYEVKRGTLKIDFLAQKHKTITQQGLQLQLYSKFSMLTVSWPPCLPQVWYP